VHDKCAWLTLLSFQWVMAGYDPLGCSTMPASVWRRKKTDKNIVHIQLNLSTSAIRCYLCQGRTSS